MTQSAMIQVALEMWGSLFCLILAVAVYLIGDKKAKETSNLILIQLSSAIVLVCDAIAWVYRGNTTQIGYYAVRISNFLCFVINYINLMLYTRYIKVCIQKKEKLNRYCAYLIKTVYLITIIGIVLVVISQFNHMFYNFDASNRYYRGQWCWLLQVIGIIGLLIDLIVLLCYRRRLKKLKFWALLSYIVLPILAEIILLFYYGLSLAYFAITISTIIMFMSLLIEQTDKLARREKELADMQVNIMLSQIQPHFLYNSLNSIYYLCGKDTQAARRAISNFADYLRGNLDSLKRNTPIPFSTELKHVEVYLSLEKMRYEDELEIVYDIRTTAFSVPALTIQPIVENAVRHGLGRKIAGGKVTISTREFSDRYEIQVADDGVGYDANEIQDDGKSHVGIENVRMRLKNMCNGTLNIVGIHGVGTVATIEIPKLKIQKETAKTTDDRNF